MSLHTSRFSQEWFARLKDASSEEGEWFANIKKNMKRGTPRERQ